MVTAAAAILIGCVISLYGCASMCENDFNFFSIRTDGRTDGRTCRKKIEKNKDIN